MAALLNTSLALALVAALHGVPPLPEPLDSDFKRITSVRHFGMCQYMESDPKGLIPTLGRDRTPAGDRPFDIIYNDPINVAHRGLAELDRAGCFYEALRLVVQMHAHLIYEDNRPLLRSEIAYLAQRMRSWPSALKKPLCALARGDLDLSTLRPALQSTDEAVKRAYLANNTVSAIFASVALGADLESLLAGPIAASEQMIEVLEAIRTSTTDPDVHNACQRLIRELREGQVDYIQRLKTCAIRGDLARIARQAAIEGATKLAVTSLLSSLRVTSAATVGSVAAASMAALLAGVEVGRALTGEAEAFRYARLAHFVDFLRPGLASKWRELAERIDPGAPEVCRSFDAVTRALVLVNAAVALCIDRINDAYYPGGLSYRKCLGLPVRDRIPSLALSKYAKAYCDWIEGTLFDPYIWGPESSARAWIYRMIEPETPTKHRVGVKGVPTAEIVRGRPVDLALCVDVTGSMADDIGEVKVRALKMIDELQAASSSLRLGLVTYRDWLADGPDHLDTVVPLGDALRVVEVLRDLEVWGGGDPPEDVLDGLEAALNLDWRPGVIKLVVLIGDAPPIVPDHEGKTIEDIAELAERVDPAHIYAIACSPSADSSTFEQFDRIARLTRGQAVLAADATAISEKLVDLVRSAIAEHGEEVSAPITIATAPPTTPDPLVVVIAALLIVDALFAVALLRKRRKNRSTR